jgi:hypothetical protein
LRLVGEASDLPVGDKFHRFREIAAIEFWREVFRERAGRGERIAWRRYMSFFLREGGTAGQEESERSNDGEREETMNARWMR